MSVKSNDPSLNVAASAGANKRRSVAIAVLLFAMVAMFYAATIIRFGNAPGKPTAQTERTP